jgi:hypothetical protein
MSSDKSYLGVIVDINDPLKQGRAKVRVFGIFDDLPMEDIPWAESGTASEYFGGGKGGGAISIPRLGSVVYCSFDSENYYKLYYDKIKEYSPGLTEEMNEENSYEGFQSLLYDTEAEPGALKLFYSRKKGLVFELGDSKVQLDTQNGGQLRVVIKMGNDEIRMENKKVIINSSNIELGEGAAESVIKGDTFKRLYEQHTHIGNSGVPTSPPTVPLPPTVLSKTTKTK